MSKVTLIVDGQTFKARKDALCEFSDYFRAMFSGNYVENELREVQINVVDACSMKTIIKYIDNGLIDLTDYSLNEINDLAASANFLQITELLKQIECVLDLRLNVANCLHIMGMAEMASFPALKKLAASYALLQFKEMKAEYIPSLQSLHWYLSHSHLNTDCELSVFKMGLQWVIEAHRSADALLIVLGCLDIAALTVQELQEMQQLLKEYQYSLASKMVDCLHEIFVRFWDISTTDIVKNKQLLCELNTERVFTEVLNLVNSSMKRELKLVPCVSLTESTGCHEKGPQFIYTFDESTGFEKWLEIPEKNLWGWSVAAWGAHRLVVAGGEYGRGSGRFLRDVLVYDTLRARWSRLGARLPPRRHAGLAVRGDTLYMAGGVGSFRIVLSCAIAVDLEERSFRKLAALPDALQSPALCVHADTLYAGGHKHVYRLAERADGGERWEQAVESRALRPSCLVPLGAHVYMAQSYCSHLLRFRPGEDKYVDTYKSFVNPVVAMCTDGKSVVAVCAAAAGGELRAVERYEGGELRRTRVLWTQPDQASELTVSAVCGAVALALGAPPLRPARSAWAAQQLRAFLATPHPDY
ncbi:kelch-like protein 30 [Plutella xylostella]|uniref:kelch-like protein 30 n=1 Tax=Plutella xylostella TaxID=51655 RepID=UPI0020326134|nr:kelch-like protein 30 [Plutella xylostella]